ncbi:histone-fold-containing protein [Xylogone sp. PMI_703]|nr:histone-fold-containing protein [Xylogone sp. PMI_703]
MPPRKSDASKAAGANGDDGSGTPTVKEVQKTVEGINLEDLNLPKSIVTRLAKGILPPNTQIQGNAMLAMSKSATVFVNYLASQANTFATDANRKTIAPQDVFKALEELEFPDFAPRLEAELAKFNELQTDKRNVYRKKVAADKAAKSGSPAAGDGDADEGEMDRDGQPAAKKARIELGDVAEGDASEMHEADVDEEVDEEEGQGEEGEDEEEEDEGEEDERLEDPIEEPSQQEGEDEALDNGDESD